MYIAIISRSAPHRVADLIGYQSLIISASQNRHEGRWTIYDRRFRLKASATKNTAWSAYDNTIWNQVFPDSTAGSYQPRPQPIKYNAALTRCPSSTVQPNYRRLICLNWNDNPDGCSHSPCRYEHSCYRCIHNPWVTDKMRKAIECPHQEKRMSPK